MIAAPKSGRPRPWRPPIHPGAAPLPSNARRGARRYRRRRMVAENLNHAAIGNHATGALDQHPLQFDRQFCHPRDVRLDRGKLRKGDAAAQDWSGWSDRPRSSRMASSGKPGSRALNEGQPLMGLWAVNSLISRTAFSPRQEADLFISADRGHLDPRGQAKLSDGQHAVSACTFS